LLCRGRLMRVVFSPDTTSTGLSTLSLTTLFRSGPPLEHVHPIDARAEVLPELLLGGHEQHEAVGGLVDLVADALFHAGGARGPRSEEHTSELQSRENLVCRLLLEKKNEDGDQHV